MGCEMEILRPIFKTEMLVFQSKPNLEENIFMVKSFNQFDLEIRIILVRTCLGTRIPNSIPVHHLLAIEIKILFLRVTV